MAEVVNLPETDTRHNFFEKLNGNFEALAGGGTGGGGLTNDELRATPVDVKLTNDAAAPANVKVVGTATVTGPLTDVQLRGTPVKITHDGAMPVSGPLTNAQMRAESLVVTPQFTNSGIMPAVSVNGTAWTRLPAQPLSQLTIYNDTGYTLLLKQGTAENTVPMWTDREAVFFGVTNADVFYVKRKDGSADAVSVQLRWEA